MKPTFKAPGTERLKLKCDEPLSNIGFNFNLCRYTLGSATLLQNYHNYVDITTVRRRRLPLSNPC